MQVFLGFGGLGGNNARQSWLKYDIIVSLSTPCLNTKSSSYPRSSHFQAHYS